MNPCAADVLTKSGKIAICKYDSKLKIAGYKTILKVCGVQHAIIILNVGLLNRKVPFG
jgi:hypothetical protein